MFSLAALLPSFPFVFEADAARADHLNNVRILRSPLHEDYAQMKRNRNKKRHNKRRICAKKRKKCISIVFRRKTAGPRKRERKKNGE